MGGKQSQPHSERERGTSSGHSDAEDYGNANHKHIDEEEGINGRRLLIYVLVIAILILMVLIMLRLLVERRNALKAIKKLKLRDNSEGLDDVPVPRVKVEEKAADEVARKRSQEFKEELEMAVKKRRDRIEADANKAGTENASGSRSGSSGSGQDPILTTTAAAAVRGRCRDYSSYDINPDAIIEVPIEVHQVD